MIVNHGHDAAGEPESRQVRRARLRKLERWKRQR